MVQATDQEVNNAIEKVHIPPLKTQGIKTKLVPWIARCAAFDVDTVWVEPFMGSGVVASTSRRSGRFSRTRISISLTSIEPSRTASLPPRAAGSFSNRRAPA